jgi:hypothetical protein
VNLARREVYSTYQFSMTRSHVLLSNRESLRCNLTRSCGFKGQNAAASAKDLLASARTPRLLDPRGSRRDGGHSETRPRVKLKTYPPKIPHSKSEPRAGGKSFRAFSVDEIPRRMIALQHFSGGWPILPGRVAHLRSFFTTEGFRFSGR